MSVDTEPKPRQRQQLATDRARGRVVYADESAPPLNRDQVARERERLKRLRQARSRNTAPPNKPR